MQTLLAIPHHVSPGMCPVNGIRDLVHWRTGRDWSSELLHGLGQGGGFAYLRINVADPPRQVYWGIASPRQHRYLANLFGARYAEIENRSFKFTWPKACQAVDAGTPPILGPLDMFHLHFYPGLYHQRHIPIHYLLLVGYDDTTAYVFDTGTQELQALPLTELEQAWDVNVPGLGKHNHLAILDIPKVIAPTDELIRRSIGDQCKTMLKPPVSMIGLPAMEKVAREIANWPQELGQESAEKSLQQVREYLNSPPDILGNHLTAGRDLYIAFLEQAGPLSEVDFSAAIERIQRGMELIPGIAHAIQQGDLPRAAHGFAMVAQLEKEAYTILLTSLGEIT